jgi:hypothetical protein
MLGPIQISGSWAVHLPHPRLNLVDGADVAKDTPLQRLGDMALDVFLEDFLERGLLQGRRWRCALDSYFATNQMWPLQPVVTLYRLVVTHGDRLRGEEWYVCRINDRFFAVGQPSDLAAESILNDVFAQSVTTPCNRSPG